MWYLVEDPAIEQLVLLVVAVFGTLHLHEEVNEGFAGGWAMDIVPLVEKGLVLSVLDSAICVPKSGLQHDF